MSNGDDELHRPGEIVSTSCIYECDCGEHHEYSTDVKGHRFPPLHDACTGTGWKLKAPSHPNA
ncbi:hypothetical protein [Streptomyces prasinus]|uniref:hypothetical protein n=1 Tax=Streptomyces prasinus TaxID=67345 RepID=UPI00363ACB35